MNFEQIARVLQIVQSTSSTNAKKDLLSKFAGLPGLKEILDYIYNPSFCTGIGSAKLSRAMYDAISNNSREETVEEIMAFLRTSNTGSDYAAMRAAAFVLQWDDSAAWLAEGLVTQNLQLGCSVKTLNKVFGEGFIPVVDGMFGELCPDVLPAGLYIESEKIDGQRRFIFKHDDNNILAFTRSGKPDPYLVEVLPAFKQLPSMYMYDVELTAIGEFPDSIALRQATNSRASVKGPRTGLKANIFDCVHLPGIDNKAVYRKAFIASLFGDLTSLEILKEHIDINMYTNYISMCSTAVKDTTFVDALPVLGFCTTKEQALAHTQPIWDAKREGMMLLKADSYYERKRTYNLLKIKSTKEDTLLCTGVYEGTNANEGALGGVHLDYKGYVLDCGSGFSQYERDLYWQAPELIVGKMIEIESFGESTNKQGGLSLSCPIFKRIKGDD